MIKNLFVFNVSIFTMSLFLAVNPSVLLANTDFSLFQIKSDDFVLCEYLTLDAEKAKCRESGILISIPMRNISKIVVNHNGKKFDIDNIQELNDTTKNKMINTINTLNKNKLTEKANEKKRIAIKKKEAERAEFRKKEARKYKNKAYQECKEEKVGSANLDVE